MSFEVFIAVGTGLMIAVMLAAGRWLDVKAWKSAGGNVSRMANLLNVSRVTLYRYLKKYNLDKKKRAKA